MAKGKEINDLTSKATPTGTDEIEIQETSGGASKKTTLTAAIGNVAPEIVLDITPQLGGELDGQDNTISKVNLKDTGVITQALTGTGNKTIDLETGNSVTHTAFGAITWTFSNPTATNAMSTIYLSLITGGTGAQTFPATVIWENGSAPTLLVNDEHISSEFV